ncbi:DNA primase [Nanobdella aerobiophila]|uniref:DNA primase n=1 Tax=Nanobdella aerobiophila TaxID=2586965 RepID=A0A915SL82_9ARCH|nr:DNA primase small subunit domain-containing protein [Nanobdella aerobiophila]BBL45796.1 DNA primase [Nanobdella aerobiophila]
MSIFADKLIKYYNENKEIVDDIITISQNREVGYLLSNGSFGYRPSKIDSKEDIINFIKKGAISFHISIERWVDLDILKEKSSKREVDDYRLGWDFIIDIDSKSLDLSKVAAKIIVDYINEKNISPFYIKYSGGKGFHIAIPWEIFPKTLNIEKKGEIIEEETRKLFPDLARYIALYIANEVKDKLSKTITIKFSEEELKNFGIDNMDNFDPYKIVEIDTILISSRHLFRSIYSINEKTGNLSIPIKYNYISKLDPKDANIDNYYYENVPYLTEELKKEENKNFKDLIHASLLFKANNEININQMIRSAHEYKDNRENKEIEKDIKYIKNKNLNITEELFPPCIKNILNNKETEDGRKRAVFILINFLANIGWDWDKIEKYVNDWNRNLADPLKDRYIEYQINWHKKIFKENKKYLTPNCSNEIYYKDIGICTPDDICKLIKNPISYPIKKIKNSKYSQDSQNN